jgi:outer membrane protein TolC
MIFFLLFAQIDSLSIDQSLDRALSQSPTYYESKVSLDKSRIEFYQTLSNLLPTLSANAKYTMNEQGDFGTNPYSGSVTMTQPLLDLDIISSVFVSNRQFKSDNLQHIVDIAGLTLNVKTAYYNLIYASELLKSSEIAIKRAKENLEIIETKYTIGAASKLDKLQAEVFYLSTLQDKASAMTLRMKAQEELKSLLGVDNDIYPVDSLLPPNTSEFPPIDSLIVLLEVANYNIRIAQELENVAKLDLLSSYLAFLPKVSFFYGYTYSSDELTFDFQQWRDNSTKNYGINISFPIFEIKSLIFNNLNAKKELQFQKISKERIRLESQKSLRTTYYGLQEAYDRLQFSIKSFDAATEAVMIAKEQYALGTISFLDLLTAEEDAYNAQVSYTSAVSDFYVQRANLSYLLGDLALEKEQR